ncbi:MAG TPA: glycosyltransferase family 4 protein [Lacipirellulaceae bacterium]|jgi:glycosyltransferase involved in cell wall biosynthesis|nr:glycosyltransferase family 4 protein [Lacipirellulaceae bacterium]
MAFVDSALQQATPLHSQISSAPVEFSTASRGFAVHSAGSSRVPRVLHAIAPSKFAGAETFLARLMRRSPRDQFVNHCVTTRNRANGELLAANIPFDRLRIGGKANLLAVPRLAAAAHRFQADVFHTHLSTASWWCGWLEQFGGPPSIGHVHGFTSAHWHRHQRHLIACSAAVKRDLIEKGIAADRITTLHYPVDAHDLPITRSRAEVRRELGAEDETPVVGTFAHLSRKKGYCELIEAAALVLNVFPTAQFWVFGEGPLRNKLEETSQRRGIADRFKLFGFRRDVANLMSAIDIMCLPSHREPFGLVYIEAALAQKPVIACRAGGVPEIVSHGESGLIIPPPTNASGAEHLPLVDALFELLDNRNAALEMGRRAREAALDRFRWSDYLTNLRALYDRVRA